MLGSARVRRQIFAFLLLTAGCYGIIALGRGVFFQPGAVALIRAERFQYVGPMALTLTLCAALAGVGSRRILSEGVKTTSLFLWLAAVLLLELRIGTPINHYTAVRREAQTVVSTLRKAIESAPRGEDLYFENRLFRGSGQILTSPTIFPGWAGIFTIFFPDNRVDGKQVHFIIDNEEAVAIARRGQRTADLVVSPAEARARNAKPIDLPWPAKKKDAGGRKQEPAESR
jgi:hypothetical protein